MFEELSCHSSFVRNLDSRVKIMVVFFFSVVMAASNRFVVLTLGLGTGLFLVLLARTPTDEIIRRLIPVNIFILFLWLFLPFICPGRLVFIMGPFSVTYEGLLYASRISIKSNAIMLMLIALVASTPVFALGQAMHELKVPTKLVHLFVFTYRYLHVIHREYLRLLNSMKIRAFRPRTDWHTYKTFAYLVGMLLVRSFDRAQRVHNAMLCRGFRGNFYTLSEFSLKGKDVIFIVLMVVVILVMGVLEWIKTI
ncbi:MAG: cobalt ECF transporter T component CbiQ [Deltaproteobacteria bacterium CG1_02_45_11]|nr:MAG: cobalt ECF transporter T component CbiQ [Deltaproteobacteria bacterium CG1_02_45_11]